MFRDEVLSIQGLTPFVHFLWYETKVFFVDDPKDLCLFHDWVSAYRVFLWVFLVFGICWLVFCMGVSFSLVSFGSPFRRPFLIDLFF